MSEKITNINKQTCSFLRDELDKELKALGDKYGLQMKTGKATYCTTGITFSLDVAVVDNNGIALTQEVRDYNANCVFYGFKKEHLNQVFESQGKKMKLIGMKVKNHKYPFIVEDVYSKNKYKMTPDQVKRAMGL